MKRSHGGSRRYWSNGEKPGLTRVYIINEIMMELLKDFQVTNWTSPGQERRTLLSGRQKGLSLSTLWCCAVVFLRLLYTKQVEF